MITNSNHACFGKMPPCGLQEETTERLDKIGAVKF
jgi:hypothetical protein